MDFNSSSGWNTPRRMPVPHVEPSQTDFAALWARKMERSSGTRLDARTALEDKVAKVAAKKCSVEEVSALYKELEKYVNTDGTEHTSLFLSFVLLRCILMNHQAHSEASRNMKTVEANLKAQIDDLQLTNEKIESELRNPMRHTTPAPPPIPTKPRRLSTPSPPKMMRSSSEEKAELHQIWVPPGSDLRPPSRSATRTPYTTASSRFSPSVAR
ncbi:hypothetical protein H0H87_006723 [Tephrocybe sp. NHM501043]|nr:hypothetical protein H0H87_006723 [Tephrocybe sp. NHM501043]